MTVSIERFEKVYRQLLFRTHQLAPDESISFTTGLWEREEGYKRNYWDDARALLKLETWQAHKNDPDYILSLASQVFTNNLVSYENYSKLFEIFTAGNVLKKKAADALYDIYFGPDDEAAFNSFASVLNSKHMNDPLSIASLYFFLKDKTEDGDYRYVTSRRAGTGEQIAKLHLNASCVQVCTWENYQQYLQIVRDLQKLLKRYHPKTTLLDAQSFLWMLHFIDPSTPEYNESEDSFTDYSNGIVHISKEQWVMLIDEGVITEEDIEYLAKFYASPEHASTPLRLSILENTHPTSYTSPCVSLAKRVSERLSIPEIPREETGGQKYYPVLFLGKYVDDERHFAWKLRPELIEALEKCSVRQLERAIQEMYRAEENAASELSDDELLEQAKMIHNGPAHVYTSVTQQRQRDPRLVLAAKRRANGICQLCGKMLDFNDRQGKPYLEVHHIIPLSENGPDELSNMVALCPNCHRRMHILNAAEDKAKLEEVAAY